MFFVVGLVCVMLMALAGIAFAGGVVITLDGMPADVRPGQPFDVGFSIISAHTSDPVSGEQPHVEAVNPKTGEVISQMGRPDGTPGHYVATLTLPVEGRWEWRIQPFPLAEGWPAAELTPIQVQAVAASVAPASALADSASADSATADSAVAAPAPQAGPFASPATAPALGALALLALVAVSFALRSRLRPVRL
jgi:hypothetical protein